MDRKRILVVDDEVDVNATLKMILEMEDFIVDTFEDPLLALSSFKPHFYDLALLDIIMPKMDGFDLFNQLRKKDNNVKILFLTANDVNYSRIQRDRYSNINKELILKKPIDNEDLVEKINSILETG